ncbi:MAG: TetR/AcrR family transcriptional regulator [Chloroflexi bacterium]|nr:TetR/AcrR family transcriptional regulator [Chloroflexota bacterium]
MQNQPMQKRSLETRQALLEATLDAIQILGYQNASTSEIIERAGVSRGAMLHHYPTKTDLLAATFQYLHNQTAADVERLIKTAEAEGLTWADLLDEIMARFFQGRIWDVFLEITVAARTDPELWTQLVPIVQQYYAQVDSVWHHHFTTAVVDSEITTLLNLSLCVLRGMALQMLIRDDPQYYLDIMQQWKAMIMPLVNNRLEAGKINETIK